MAFRMVIDYEGGSWQPDVDGTFSQDAFAYHVSISCNHCNNPVCTRVCPTGAMHKDELGLVWPDATKCIGCGYCTMACPYHAPHIDAPQPPHPAVACGRTSRKAGRQHREPNGASSMTSGFDAFSLGLFTSLAPAGVVAFLALALVRLWSRDRTASVRIDRMIALPFSVVLIGFIASATHLGTPANALHVFSGVGRSPLSNEVLSAVAFLFLVGSYWMMAFKERFPDAVAKPWLALACLAGIALIACTSMAYNVDTVPTWDTAFTPANLVLAALLAGPVLGLLFLELAQVRPRALERALVVLAALALVAGTVVLALHQESLSAIANNEFAASTLAPSYPAVIGAHLIVGAIALAIAGLSMKRVQSRRTTLALRATASLLALAAVFVTRIVFYHLHMTVGF